jgi:hypothetical protein
MSVSSTGRCESAVSTSRTLVVCSSSSTGRLNGYTSAA